jgi:hypothetical protein
VNSSFTDAPAPHPAGEAGASELARLRRSVTLNTEIIGALRTARDRLTQQNAELATLLAQYSTQLQFHTSEFLELHALHGADAEELALLVEDLTDYTNACADSLALKKEPILLRELLLQVLTNAAAERRSGASVGIAAELAIEPEVSERVLGDAARLMRMLTVFLSQPLREYADEPLTLSVTRAGGALVRLSLRRSADAPPLNKAALGSWTPANAGPESRLRAALAARLCELMQANVVCAPDTPDGALLALTLPLQPALDPAQTGKFRIATLSKSANSAPPVRARRATDRALAEGEGAIDFMYLDRQLGSLARTILARTAPAFLASMEARMTSLVVAQQSGDLARLGAIAQAWKGSAMSVGARPLAQLLGAMEKQAAGGQLPGEESSRQISLALERLQRALERFCRDELAP